MRSSLPILILSPLALTTAVRAEVPLLQPAELQREAKHIVTGKVENVYTTEKALDRG